MTRFIVTNINIFQPTDPLFLWTLLVNQKIKLVWPKQVNLIIFIVSQAIFSAQTMCLSATYFYWLVTFVPSSHACLKRAASAFYLHLKIIGLVSPMTEWNSSITTSVEKLLAMKVNVHARGPLLKNCCASEKWHAWLITWETDEHLLLWPYKAVKSNCVDAIIWFGKLIWATSNFTSAMHKWGYYSNLHNIRLPLCIVEDLITTILFYRCTTDLHLSGTLSQLWQSAIASQHMLLFGIELHLPVLAQMMQWW